VVNAGTGDITAAGLLLTLETDCDAGEVTVAAAADGVAGRDFGAVVPEPRPARREGPAAVGADVDGCDDGPGPAGPASVASAHAVPAPVNTAVPTPRLMANAPIRPMCAAARFGQPIGSLLPLANCGL